MRRTKSDTRTNTLIQRQPQQPVTNKDDEGWTSASSVNETPEKQSPSESPKLVQSLSQPALNTLPLQFSQQVSLEEKTPKPSTSSGFSFTTDNTLSKPFNDIKFTSSNNHNLRNDNSSMNNDNNDFNKNSIKVNHNITNVSNSPKPLSITSSRSNSSSKPPPSIRKVATSSHAPLAQVDTKTVAQAHLTDPIMRSPSIKSPQLSIPQRENSSFSLQDNLASKLGPSYSSSFNNVTSPSFINNYNNNYFSQFSRSPKSHLVISNFTPSGSSDLPPTPTYSKLISNPYLTTSHSAVRTFFNPQKDSLERCTRYGKFDPPPKWFEPVKNNQHPFFHPRKSNVGNKKRPQSMIIDGDNRLFQKLNQNNKNRNSVGQHLSSAVVTPFNRVWSGIN